MTVTVLRAVQPTPVPLTVLFALNAFQTAMSAMISRLVVGAAKTTSTSTEIVRCVLLGSILTMPPTAVLTACLFVNSVLMESVARSVKIPITTTKAPPPAVHACRIATSASNLASAHFAAMDISGTSMRLVRVRAASQVALSVMVLITAEDVPHHIRW
jgi:hypothetical protein